MSTKLLATLLIPTLVLLTACSDAGEQIGVTEDPGRFQTPQESEYAPDAATDHDQHEPLPAADRDTVPR